jgi:hypothetical protein
MAGSRRERDPEAAMLGHVTGLLDLPCEACGEEDMPRTEIMIKASFDGTVRRIGAFLCDRCRADYASGAFQTVFPKKARTRLLVDEQHDEHGDLTYAVTVVTHDRAVLAALEKQLGVEIAWRQPARVDEPT